MTDADGAKLITRFTESLAYTHSRSPAPLWDTGVGYGLPTAAVTAAAVGQVGFAPDPAAAVVALGEAWVGAAEEPVASVEDGATVAGAVAAATAGDAAVVAVAVAAVAVVGDAAAACDELLQPLSTRQSGTIAISNVACRRNLDMGIPS